jgi:glutaredoxin-related protein
MSSRSSIKSLLVGLANRLSFHERKERLLNNLYYLRQSNEQNHLRLGELHPPPDSNSYISNIDRPIDRSQNLYFHEVSQDDLICPNIGTLREAMLVELERLRRLMNGDVIENDENYIALPPEEKKVFHKFLEYFSTCPICKGKNHEAYLKTFYFNNGSDKKTLKKRLLKLMDESKDFDDVYYNKILLGIPCCDCFKKFFCEF